MILRCTARLLALLGGRDLHVAEGPPADDDDWYANLLWIGRRKCLLLTHPDAVLGLRSRRPQAPPPRAWAVRDRARRPRAGRRGPGGRHARPPRCRRRSRRANRSMLRHMHDMAFMCQQEVEIAGGLAQTDFDGVNRRLRRGLHNRGGYVVPLELAGRDLT